MSATQRKKWWQKRTRADCPESYGYLAAGAWARGYNVAVDAYLRELSQRLKDDER